MKNKNPLRRLFDRRIFWAIIALLASLSIWIYVTSADASDFRQTFRNVRVELIGEDTLRSSRNLVVTDLDISSVTVVITGSQIRYRLSQQRQRARPDRGAQGPGVCDLQRLAADEQGDPCARRL